MARYLGFGILMAFLGSWDAAGAHAQTVMRQWNPLGFQFVDSLPDLDGDGFRELVIGDDRYPSPLLLYGRVLALSSLTNQPIYSYPGTTKNMRLGGGLSVLGDVSRDGFPDFGASSILGTFVFDGRTGVPLFSTPAQSSCMAPMGDMNGDDTPEFLINGRFMYAGGTFEYLYGIFPPPNATGFGISQAKLGDIDADGIDDLVIGAPGSGSFLIFGRAYVYSGASGQLIYELVGEEPDGFFGQHLVSPGDLNGDGVSDLVVAAPRDLVQSSSGFGVGRLYFYDGPTGQLFAKVESAGYYFDLGSVLLAAGDVNGNGFGDLLAFQRQDLPTSPARTYGLIIDGGTREVIYQMSGFGPFVGGGYDWNGNGFPDFGLYPYPTPLWTLYDGAPIGVTVLGRACTQKGSEPPRIGATGVAEIGATFPLHLSRVKPGETAVLVLGDPRAVLSERFASSRDCALGLLPMSLLRTPTQEVRPGEGAATVELAIPNDPTLVGTAFHAQWLVLDGPEGLRPKASTRILRVEIQPAGTNPVVRLPGAGPSGRTRQPR